MDKYRTSINIQKRNRNRNDRSFFWEVITYDINNQRNMIATKKSDEHLYRVLLDHSHKLSIKFDKASKAFINYDYYRRVVMPMVLDNTKFRSLFGKRLEELSEKVLLGQRDYNELYADGI